VRGNIEAERERGKEEWGREGESSIERVRVRVRVRERWERKRGVLK
jgi:hypothetical protein